MDIDNFEWWYSEGEAPDEEWDEPAPCDVYMPCLLYLHFPKYSMNNMHFRKLPLYLALTAASD